jgi:hypothetical protein
MSSSVKGREGERAPMLHHAKEVLLQSWAATTAVVSGRRGDEEGSIPRGLNVQMKVMRQADHPVELSTPVKPVNSSPSS